MAATEPTYKKWAQQLTEEQNLKNMYDAFTEGGVARQGWLLKKISKNTWHRCWLCIKGESVLFYRDPKKKPKRTLKATTVTFYDSAGPCMFTVKAGEKSWVFRCECERDSEEWLVAFQLMEGFAKRMEDKAAIRALRQANEKPEPQPTEKPKRSRFPSRKSTKPTTAAPTVHQEKQTDQMPHNNEDKPAEIQNDVTKMEDNSAIKTSEASSTNSEPSSTNTEPSSTCVAGPATEPVDKLETSQMVSSVMEGLLSTVSPAEPRAREITRQLYILAQAEAWIASKKQSLREEARNIISQTDKQDEDLRALTRIILGLAKT